MIALSRVLVEGKAHLENACEVLHSDTPLSFWGGVDPLSGEVIDHTHPLRGQSVTGKILCIPSGRGSCTGSQVMLELILNGMAPAAMVLTNFDTILCTGAIIAEEVFGNETFDNVPLIVLVDEEDFEALGAMEFASFERGQGGGSFMRLVAGSKNSFSLEENRNSTEKLPQILSGGVAYELQLTQEEQDILAGKRGTAADQIALRTICRIARITSSPRLIPVSQAHIDGCTYIGPGGLRFVKKLVELGGKVTIPTTLNSVVSANIASFISG